MSLDQYYNKDNVEKKTDPLENAQANSIEALSKELINLKVIPDKLIRNIAILLPDPYYRKTLIPIINLSKTSKKFNYAEYLLRGIELISNGIKENNERSLLGKIRDKLPF